MMTAVFSRMYILLSITHLSVVMRRHYNDKRTRTASSDRLYLFLFLNKIFKSPAILFFFQKCNFFFRLFGQLEPGFIWKTLNFESVPRKWFDGQSPSPSQRKKEKIHKFGFLLDGQTNKTPNKTANFPAVCAFLLNCAPNRATTSSAHRKSSGPRRLHTPINH
jgi:hypothetical protein